MKTKFFAIAALAATTLFASCNRDKDDINILEESGKATSMKVSISFPNVPQTRATGDLNATEDEAKVNTVDVFIYYTATGGFQSHTHLKADAFTSAGTAGNADLYTANTKIDTTTGAKSVFAGINLPSSVVEALQYQPLSALATVAHTMMPADLTASSGFAMFSTEAVNRVFEEDENALANKITLKCQRMVAKVTVETTAGMEQGGVPGTLGVLEFAVNNFNTKLFMLQGVPEYHKDPNWAIGSFAASDFITNPVGTDYAPVLRRVQGDNPSMKTDYKARYAAENSSEGKLKKEITRVTVRSTFIPEKVTVYTNRLDNTAGYELDAPHGGTTPQTFYAITPSVTEGTFYFFSKAIADNFAADHSAEILTYVNGLCYWDIFLNKNPINEVNKWDVLRNDLYKCRITRIVTPGRPSPEVPNPEIKPEDVETNITADIEILFWNTPIESNYVLE